MSLALHLVALVLAASSPPPEACAPDPPGVAVDAGAESYIRRAELDWAASISGDEAGFLRRVTTTDFVAAFDGRVLTRAQLIGDAQARPPGAASDTLTAVRVHLSGPVAIAEGVETWLSAHPPRRSRIVWSDAWTRCGGEWRLRSSMAVSEPQGRSR